MLIFELLSGSLTLLLLIPVGVFFFQVLIGLPVYRSSKSVTENRSNVAILIPAHNESTGIANTLASINPQMIPGDRLVVIADNCTDNTAEIALACGAEVIIRSDNSLRGKGYALDFGIRHLTAYQPDIVIFIDADCIVHEGAIAHLALSCRQYSRPVQALYLMLAPENAGIKLRFAQFAWSVKNRLRALGYHRVNLPSSLKGSGMAFPWTVINQAQLANAQIVEDLKMGIDFACAGFAPIFCPEALVTSFFPNSAAGVTTQRTRWEHGHLAIILSEFPRLIASAIKNKDKGLIFLALDLCVPPLALLALSIFSLVLLNASAYVILGAAAPLCISILDLLLLITAVILAWWSDGRQLISLMQLLYTPIYIFRKIPLYFNFLFRRQVEWIRSSRDKN